MTTTTTTAQQIIDNATSVASSSLRWVPGCASTRRLGPARRDPIDAIVLNAVELGYRTTREIREAFAGELAPLMQREGASSNQQIRNAAKRLEKAGEIVRFRSGRTFVFQPRDAAVAVETSDAETRGYTDWVAVMDEPATDVVEPEHTVADVVDAVRVGFHTAEAVALMLGITHGDAKAMLDRAVINGDLDRKLIPVGDRANLGVYAIAG